MRDLPESDTEIEQPEPRHSAAHPAGSDGSLKTHESGLVRRVDEEIVIRPVAQPERMNPRQEREHDAHFKAQDDVKNNAQPG